MHLVLNKIRECAGCRFYQPGPDGRGVYDPETACGTCERNPRLVEFLTDRKEKLDKRDSLIPPESLELPPGEAREDIQKGTDTELKDWGLHRRPRPRPRR